MDQQLQAKVVSYADDFVILCRGTAADARVVTTRWMRALKLTLNETKTRVCNANADVVRPDTMVVGIVQMQSEKQISRVFSRLLAPVRLAAWFTALVLGAGCFTSANLPEGVTVEAVRRVALGMSRQEVEGILGPAMQVEEGIPEFDGKGRQTLVYFRRMPPLLWRHPKLWVHLRHGRVEEVYAKRDDEAIYFLDADGSFEGKLFRETFPSSQR